MPRARRELVFPLLNLGRTEEAAAEAEEALRLSPTSPASHYFHGMVLAHTGRLREAREAFRRAIALSVNAEFAISQLIIACDTLAQRKEEVAFIRSELVRQTIFGEGLLAYRYQVRDVLDAGELLASLREALSARPDLWHGWSAVTHQLLEMGQPEEAHRLALQATERFPLLPRMWLDLASVCRRSDSDGEIIALREALQINPAWGEAVRQLAEVHARRGSHGEVLNCWSVRRRRSPLDAVTQGELGRMLWKVGAATKHWSARHGRSGWIRDCNGHGRRCGNGAPELKKRDFVLDLARELTVSRAGEARSWLVLSGMLSENQQVEERLAALDRAIALNPRLEEAHDHRAWVLCNARRFDEALAACHPAIFGSLPPSRLRGRAAWIAAQKGDIHRAIAGMREVVADDPHYYWAWCRLADWYREIRNADEYLLVGRTLAGRWPLDAASQGYLGEALQWKKDRAGARAAFRESLKDDPDYVFGATSLFDMALEDGDIAEAQRAMTFLNRHPRGIRTVARECRLAAKRQDRQPALDLFGELCRHEKADGEVIDWTLKVLDPSLGVAAVNRSLRSLATETQSERTLIARLLVDRLGKAKLCARASGWWKSFFPGEGHLPMA